MASVKMSGKRIHLYFLAFGWNFSKNFLPKLIFLFKLYKSKIFIVPQNSINPTVRVA